MPPKKRKNKKKNAQPPSSRQKQRGVPTINNNNNNDDNNKRELDKVKEGNKNNALLIRLFVINTLVEDDILNDSNLSDFGEKEGDILNDSNLSNIGQFLLFSLVKTSFGFRV